MRNLIIIVAVMLYTGLSAQTINGLDITKDITSPYIMVHARGRLGKGVTVDVDFGQETKALSRKEEAIKHNGKNVKFNSPIAVLNYFLYYGYKVHQTLVRTTEKSSYLQYILINPNSAPKEMLLNGITFE